MGLVEIANFLIKLRDDIVQPNWKTRRKKILKQYGDEEEREININWIKCKTVQFSRVEES